VLVAKNSTPLRRTNFRINSTSLVYFAPNFMQLRNSPKCTQTLQNTTRHEFSVQWVDRVRSWKNISTRLCGTNFALIAPVRPVLHQISYNKQMIPNTPKHCEMHQNMSLGSKGVDQVHLLRIISI